VTGMVYSTLLASLPGIEHGFGTKRTVLSQGGMASMRQVHSNRILTTDAPGCIGEGDGLITSTRGLALSLRTADCLPILLVDPRKGVVAAIHAGWRGATAGIATEAVRRMSLEFAVDPRDLFAAIGPGIGECCYKVGPEVAIEFRKYFPERADLDGKTNINLAEANRRQLLDAGMMGDRIETIEACTSCDANLYHSYRREGARAGRMVSFIRRSGGFERSALSGADQKLVKVVRAFSLTAIRHLLALDAKRRPRYRGNPLGADVFLAMEAHAESAFVDSAQRGPYVPKQVRFTVQVANCQLALCCVLHFVKSVRAFFDCDALAIPHERLELCPLGLQNVFEFV